MRARWKVLWAVVAVLPFLGNYVLHFTSPLGGATGFTQPDMPSYCANGRAVFERGNGLAHPNPYDPDPQAPVIYFHWLTWLLGCLITKLAIDPGFALAGVGIIAALFCSWLTMELVEAVLPSRRFGVPLFLFAMWGGGVLCLTRAIQNLWHHDPWNASLFLYDPANGWWFLNWGRNLIYSTEAVYHCLMAFAWLSALRRRWLWSLVGGAFLGSTHPFSGLQLLLILFGWFTLLLAFRRSWLHLTLWMVAGTMLAAFLGYYFVFLESFPQHQKLREDWSISWTLLPATMLLAYGPVGLLAGFRIWNERHSLSFQIGFLAVCFGVSFLLANHNWFINPPRQPLHFTRGYVWMPLCLLALPYMQRILLDMQAAFSHFSLIAVGVLGIIGVSDNGAFLAQEWINRGQAGVFLTAEEREMFVWIDQRKLTGTVLCPDPTTEDELERYVSREYTISYVTATYTSLRPYTGHWSNTPAFKERKKTVIAWLNEGKTGPWLDTINYILLLKETGIPATMLQDWEPIHENGELVLYQRKKE